MRIVGVIIVVVIGGGGIGGRVVVGIGGREAEEGAEAEGEAAKLLKRQAADEVEDVAAAQTLRIAGYVLAEICREIGHRHHDKAVENHLRLPGCLAA
ncbi:hypothetical protein ACLOJK_021103 [Asimina triloba]